MCCNESRLQPLEKIESSRGETRARIERGGGMEHLRMKGAAGQGNGRGCPRSRHHSNHLHRPGTVGCLVNLQFWNVYPFGTAISYTGIGLLRNATTVTELAR